MPLRPAPRARVHRFSSSGTRRAGWSHPCPRPPRPSLDGATAEGDGLVPVGAALLEGARHVVIDGVTHGQLSGRPWYGSPQAVDFWWPIAVETWHEALRVRAVPPGSGGASGARHGPARLTGDVTYR